MSEKSWVKCPYCAEQVRAEAIKCRFCGEWLSRDSLHEQSNRHNAGEVNVSSTNTERASTIVMAFVSIAVAVILTIYWSGDPQYSVFGAMITAGYLGMIVFCIGFIIVKFIVYMYR